MATPIVSGALALVKELAPHLTAAEIIKLVSENGQKNGRASRQGYKWK